MFAGLLILLWVPLLAFSSGNPTYQVPNVVSFETNATLGVTHGNATDKLETLSFAVFRAGQRRSRQNLVGDTRDLPDSVQDTYAATQAKLLCVGQVRCPSSDVVSALSAIGVLILLLGRRNRPAVLLPQDSDEAWLASQPAQAAMRRMLSSFNASLSIGWHVRRDAPLAGAHGGPECAGMQVIPLAPRARSQLVQVLKVSRPGGLSCGSAAARLLGRSAAWSTRAVPVERRVCRASGRARSWPAPPSGTARRRPPQRAAASCTATSGCCGAATAQ